MDTVKNISLIETTLTRRGEGVFSSPIRVVTQYWTQGGKLIIESDPCAKIVTPEKLHQIHRIFERTLPAGNSASFIWSEITKILNE